MLNFDLEKGLVIVFPLHFVYDFFFFFLIFLMLRSIN